MTSLASAASCADASPHSHFAPSRRPAWWGKPRKLVPTERDAQAAPFGRGIPPTVLRPAPPGLLPRLIVSKDYPKVPPVPTA